MCCGAPAEEGLTAAFLTSCAATARARPLIGSAGEISGGLPLFGGRGRPGGGRTAVSPPAPAVLLPSQKHGQLDLSSPLHARGSGGKQLAQIRRTKGLGMQPRFSEAEQRGGLAPAPSGLIPTEDFCSVRCCSLPSTRAQIWKSVRCCSLPSRHAQICLMEGRSCVIQYPVDDLIFVLVSVLCSVAWMVEAGGAPVLRA